MLYLAGQFLHLQELIKLPKMSGMLVANFLV